MAGKCKHCGRSDLDHNSKTNACPKGKKNSSGGYNDYDLHRKYEPHVYPEEKKKNGLNVSVHQWVVDITEVIVLSWIGYYLQLDNGEEVDREAYLRDQMSMWKTKCKLRGMALAEYKKIVLSSEFLKVMVKIRSGYLNEEYSCDGSNVVVQ